MLGISKKMPENFESQLFLDYCEEKGLGMMENLSDPILQYIQYNNLQKKKDMQFV